MLEKLIALFLLAFFLLAFGQILRFTYLAWFRANDLIGMIKENTPDWQKRLHLSLNQEGNHRRLAVLRFSMLFVFLISLPVFFILVWLVIVTWID
jgi:hypothetical protein